jgi:hypothetical protein
VDLELQELLTLVLVAVAVAAEAATLVVQES